MRGMKPQMPRMKPQISQIPQIGSLGDQGPGADPRDLRTHAIIGAAMEVHRHLGCGFLEAVYQEALAIELGIRGIPNVREASLPLHYKGTRLDTHYRSDFVCHDGVIVEIKAISRIGPVEEAQIINYLNASQYSVGLLLNFGGSSLEFKRYINTAPPSRATMSNAADNADSDARLEESAKSAKSAVARQS